MAASFKAISNMQASVPDQSLVRDCLHANEEAWALLIDRYKNLIFSIPVKLGFSPDDAADIFQGVCVALVEELPRLREPRALPAWLIQTTSRKCLRWKNESRRYVDAERLQETLADESAKIPGALLEELDREQIVRDAVSELPTDCKRLVELLFYHVPPLNYEDLAAALHMPKGSIGPTRMRCLRKVRRLLVKKGF
jgi:RNA polymerase sigma factor (sigma-70 family)